VSHEKDFDSIELRKLWRSSFPEWKPSHEKDIAKASTKDRHWIIKLSNIDRHRDWLIITKDKGAKDKRDRDKLPRICKRHNYAYLIVSHTLRRADQMKAGIASVWPDFVLVVRACEKLRRQTKRHVKLNQMIFKSGTGYALQIGGSGIRDFLGEPRRNVTSDVFRLE
jgi:hypothetical protein